MVETDKDGQLQKSKVIAVDFNVTLNTIKQLYPNPVIDNTTLFFNSIQGGLYQLNVSNANGLCVYSAVIPAMVGENRFSISMAEYPGGVYLITLLASDLSTSSVQIVKK